MGYSAPTFVVILAIFTAAQRFEWKEWVTAIVIGVLALIYIGVIVRGVSKTGRGDAAAEPEPVAGLHRLHRHPLEPVVLQLLVGVQIVQKATDSTLVAAGLTASFNAGAGIIGFPLGGWLADRQIRHGKGRKPLVLICSIAYSLLALAFGFSIREGNQPSLLLLGVLLFTSGLFFNALQPIVQGMTGDMVPPHERGSVFGLLNLISEIGAVASPVVSGVIYDHTGDWSPGVYTAAGIMIASVFLYMMVEEKFPSRHEDAALT